MWCGDVGPWSVIMVDYLLVYRSLSRSMYSSFILMCLRPLRRPNQPTESYAFLISCRISQASRFGVDLASSSMLVRMLIGTCVDVPFRTEQLLPWRTLLILHVFSILLVI